MDINAKMVDSPLYKFIMYLNKYEEDVLNDENFQLLIKNLGTHFKKLFYMTTYINKIEKNTDFLKSYDGTGIISVSAIEYCYYKISTIWDIAYQIADNLIFPKKKGAGKYDFLEREFKKYNEDNLSDLNLKWYMKINNIRNRIVHGGISVIPFYIDDDRVKSKICFQAYDFSLNDLIEYHYMYSNENNNNINFADYYFTFHIHLLYSYLFDFFDFIVFEMNKGKGHDLNNLSLDDMPYELFERGHKTWLLSDVDEFCKITREMISLQLSEGNFKNISKIPSEDIEEFFNLFPFSFMKKIRGAYYVQGEDGSKKIK